MFPFINDIPLRGSVKLLNISIFGELDSFLRVLSKHGLPIDFKCCSSSPLTERITHKMSMISNKSNMFPL